jgi:hypothetical protein
LGFALIPFKRVEPLQVATMLDLKQAAGDGHFANFDFREPADQ